MDSRFIFIMPLPWNHFHEKRTAENSILRVSIIFTHIDEINTVMPGEIYRLV